VARPNPGQLELFIRSANGRREARHSCLALQCATEPSVSSLTLLSKLPSLKAYFVSVLALVFLALPLFLFASVDRGLFVFRSLFMFAAIDERLLMTE